MSLTRAEREKIIEFILSNIRDHPVDIVKFTQNKYALTRQAITRYLVMLINEKKISAEGHTRNRKYSLLPAHIFNRKYLLLENLAEDKVWRVDIKPLLLNLPENVFKICEYGFSEIFNNAIDHSEGSEVIVGVKIFIDTVWIMISDNGVGIFNKIQKQFNLDDPIHSILELSKGKLTTEPKSHTGEGIFFTSRLFDLFVILSGRINLVCTDIDVLYENQIIEHKGTTVTMQMSTKSAKNMNEIFNKYSSDVEEPGFDRTIVPVKLMRYGDENLISRSQARRLLTRFEKFKDVVLDFQDVSEIGRAFTDEIFRVFRNAHPQTRIRAINTNKKIDQLIEEIEKQGKTLE